MWGGLVGAFNMAVKVSAQCGTHAYSRRNDMNVFMDEKAVLSYMA